MAGADMGYLMQAHAAVDTLPSIVGCNNITEFTNVVAAFLIGGYSLLTVSPSRIHTRHVMPFGILSFSNVVQLPRRKYNYLFARTSCFCVFLFSAFFLQYWHVFLVEHLLFYTC